jgi:hypothetical protein
MRLSGKKRNTQHGTETPVRRIQKGMCTAQNQKRKSTRKSPTTLVSERMPSYEGLDPRSGDHKASTLKQPSPNSTRKWNLVKQTKSVGTAATYLHRKAELVSLVLNSSTTRHKARTEKQVATGANKMPKIQRPQDACKREKRKKGDQIAGRQVPKCWG